MRPLRNHPLLLLNSEFSSHNTKVTAILFALAPADFAPLRPPMPAHACIRLAVLPMPAEPAYGRIFGDCLRQFASSFAYAGSRLHTAHATLLAHGQYALLSRYCPKGNTRSLSRYWRRQYALLAQLLALPIRWAWRTKCAFALNGKGDNHYKTTFGTFHRIGAIYLCH